ncbi:hypothetical protein [Kibdelosporangium aridum]|nr:hypothetical protein [Kibdelosporangium aridum]
MVLVLLVGRPYEISRQVDRLAAAVLGEVGAKLLIAAGFTHLWPGSD